MVQDCLSIEDAEGKAGLNSHMVRKFPHWAQHYILAYIYLEHEMEETIHAQGLEEVNIEKGKKKQNKTH